MVDCPHVGSTSPAIGAWCLLLMVLMVNTDRRLFFSLLLVLSLNTWREHTTHRTMEDPGIYLYKSRKITLITESISKPRPTPLLHQHKNGRKVTLKGMLDPETPPSCPAGMRTWTWEEPPQLRDRCPNSPHGKERAWRGLLQGLPLRYPRSPWSVCSAWRTWAGGT